MSLNDDDNNTTALWQRQIRAIKAGHAEPDTTPSAKSATVQTVNVNLLPSSVNGAWENAGSIVRSNLRIVQNNLFEAVAQETAIAKRQDDGDHHRQRRAHLRCMETEEALKKAYGDHGFQEHAEADIHAIIEQARVAGETRTVSERITGVIVDNSYLRR